MLRMMIGLALSVQALCVSFAWSQAPPPQTTGAAPKSDQEFSPYLPQPGDRRETVQLDRACRHIQNSEECAQAVEKMQLPRYPQQVSRQGKTLRLTLQGGGVVELKDGTKGNESDVTYQFREYLPDLGYYLVHIQYFEGDAYLMVNCRTGVRYTLHDLFLLSPNRQRLATVIMSEVHNPTAVQIWAITPEKMTLEWSHEPENWGPTNGAWRDNDTLTFSQTSLDQHFRPVNRGTMEVRKSSQGWRLSGPKP